ncbi:MAG: hypothetical protein HY791_39570 [Deltaproteobacteria bacterium]|nr:hypothetical protein [Deltaproteobacteria bacterium]
MTARQRLSEIGTVFVTLTAARSYLAASARTHDERLDGEESARRELTLLLLEAVRVQGDTETPERWRFRRRSERIDITARVIREGPLAVVLSVSARPYG